MASGDLRGTSSPSLRLLRAKSASGVRISSHGAQPRSIQLRLRASSSDSLSLGPRFSTKVSSTGNSSELKALAVRLPENGGLRWRNGGGRRRRWKCGGEGEGEGFRVLGRVKR